MPAIPAASFNVAAGLLTASLISFHLVLLSILERHPVLGNVSVVPHFLPLLRMIFILFHGTSTVWVIHFFLSFFLTHPFRQ